MNINKIGYFSTRINIGQFFEDCKEEDVYVVMREPTAIEIKDLGENTKENVEVFSKIFPACIIEHNFTDDEENKVDNKKAASVIQKSASCFYYVINGWSSELPLAKASRKNLPE